MKSRYHLYCDVWSESYRQGEDEDEDEEENEDEAEEKDEYEVEEKEEEEENYEFPALVTVQIRYWKIEQPALELTAVGSRLRDFDLLDAVEYNGELFDEVPAILTEFGIKEEGHQVMIDELVVYIEEVVIHGLYGRHVRVCFDIVDATAEVGEPHVEEAVKEAVRRSIIIDTDSKISRSAIVEMDLKEVEESESAKDNLEDAEMCDVMLQDPVSYVGEVVKVMGESKVSVKVEKVPDSTYDMIGGLDQQIKEMKESGFDILKIHSRRMNLVREIDLKKIAEKMNGASGAELKDVCTEAGMFALGEGRVHVTQEDFEMAVGKVMIKETEKNMSLWKPWK